jgi:2-succinyl-5-enolpyruvyl-6-hydroxy-3-cyclohexene-1-carboxylate synthase
MLKLRTVAAIADFKNIECPQGPVHLNLCLEEPRIEDWPSTLNLSKSTLHRSIPRISAKITTAKHYGPSSFGDFFKKL